MGSILKYKRLTDNAFAPVRATDKSAGCDISSAYDYVVKPKNKEIIKTDLQIMLPKECYARIAPRSGLAAKYHIDVGAGVVDADYTGNVKIIIVNHGNEDFIIKRGDRIAQLICEVIKYPILVDVS